MDHRHTSRLALNPVDPLNIHVAINDPHTPEVRCRVRDIGEDGIFVHTNVHFRRNYVVEIKLTIGTLDNEVSYRMHAMVLHHAYNGMGLMFLESQAELFDILTRLTTQAEQDISAEHEFGTALYA